MGGWIGSWFLLIFFLERLALSADQIGVFSTSLRQFCHALLQLHPLTEVAFDQDAQPRPCAFLCRLQPYGESRLSTVKFRLSLHLLCFGRQ